MVAGMTEPRTVKRTFSLPAEVSEQLDQAAAGNASAFVAEAIRHVRPWAVDASSRLEVEPGIKDPDKVRAYVEAARA